MSKDQIRDQQKSYRSKLSSTEAMEAGVRALRNLHPWLNHPGPWLLYADIQNEISTVPLFEALRTRNKKIAFSRIDENFLDFREIKNLDELQSGRFGREPSPTAPKVQLDAESAGIVIVPGLAFSKEGHRLGFGKGFYDRFLRAHPSLFRMGLAYDFQISTNTLPTEAHDEIMDHIVCPSGLWGSSRIEIMLPLTDVFRSRSFSW